MNRIRTIAVCALIFFVISGMGTLNAQVAARPQRLTEASTLTIVGKVMEGEPVYHRADTNLAIFRNAPPAIKRMLAYSTGLGISFRTNSTAITARWCTSPRQASSNNTGILTEGLDLYIKREEKWIHAGIGRPDTKKNCSSYTLVENMDTGWKECLLYLPVVDELKSLTIGTDADAQIIKGNNPFKHKILIYGSSIAHGSAASRPGMTYPARLSRLTGINFINFGFAGNAKMEKNMAESLSQLNVDAFILDCVPNTNPKLILERTANLVKIIRAKHPGKPIIAIQSVIREGGNFNREISQRVKEQNLNFLREIQKLQQTDKDLYFISAAGLLGNDHEGSIDGTHPNDLGFDRMVHALRPILLDILKKYELN